MLWEFLKNIENTIIRVLEKNMYLVTTSKMIIRNDNNRGILSIHMIFYYLWSRRAFFGLDGPDGLFSAKHIKWALMRFVSFENGAYSRSWGIELDFIYSIKWPIYGGFIYFRRFSRGFSCSPMAIHVTVVSWWERTSLRNTRIIMKYEPIYCLV